MICNISGNDLVCLGSFCHVQADPGEGVRLDGLEVLQGR
jgi:hypothetical protein